MALQDAVSYNHAPTQPAALHSVHSHVYASQPHLATSWLRLPACLIFEIMSWPHTTVGVECQGMSIIHLSI